MTAIIIPAHNEAGVIERTLRAVLAQVVDGDEVIVVCNGCRDTTADVARQFAPRITVLETDVPSKTNALNLGDRAASSFPRVYLDADVILAPGTIAGIARALASGNWLAVSPHPVMDMDGVSWGVRAYYDVWLSLPYCRSGMIGAGVYALSERGRARFGEFPSLIADDGFIRALFSEAERGRVIGSTSVVKAPATLGWLVKIKTRSRLGGMELAATFPELLANEFKDYRGALFDVLRNPLRWPKVLVYLCVNVLARIRAKRQLTNIAHYRWEKDLSSRTGGQHG